MSVQAERYAPRGTLRPWPRRVLARIGAATVAGTSRLLLFVSFATTVAIAAFRREAWRRPVWTEFKRVLHEVAVRSLPTAVVTGLLVAFALVTQAIYWLAQTGTQGLVGPVIVIVLIRELVPILVGLIVFGRSGTATVIELGEAHPKGWMRLFEIQGLDPLALLVLPRAIAFALGSFCLGTILLSSTLLGSYLLAYGLELIAYSFWDFADVVLRGMKVQDFIVPPLKCIVIGYLVALTCCSTGLGRHDESDELQRLVPRGFVRSALAILLANTLFDLVI